MPIVASGIWTTEPMPKLKQASKSKVNEFWNWFQSAQDSLTAENRMTPILEELDKKVRM